MPARPTGTGYLREQSPLLVLDNFEQIERAVAVKPDFQVTNANAPAVARFAIASTTCPSPSSWRRRAVAYSHLKPC